MAAAASPKVLPSTLLLLFMLSSLLLLPAFTYACGSCEPIKPKPKPKPKPFPSPKAPPVNPFCPIDTIKLGACADVLGLVNVVVGASPCEKCCAVLDGLSDLEAAACLCTVIKAKVLGINLTVPVAVSALVTSCGRTLPPGFKCV